MSTAGKIIRVLAMAMAGTAAQAGDVEIAAMDSGFVTMAGGSAKGDGTIVPSAKYNYSVGYEVHYTGGFFSPPPFTPMDRKNYFLFDLSSVPDTITGASLKLWTGTLESADPFETYVLKETPDQPGALFDVSTLATTPMDGFDDPGDFAIAVASSLYMKLGEGLAILATVDVTHAMDDSFLMITFTPAGIAHLNGLRLAGGPVVLGGMVTTADTVLGTTPQQPFGFTGPDIPGGDPKTPMLILTTVPEPSGYLLMLAGLGLVAMATRRRTFQGPSSAHGA